MDLTFNIDADNLEWDLMMVDSDGNEMEIYGLDLSGCDTEGGDIVLEYDSDLGEGTATLYEN